MPDFDDCAATFDHYRSLPQGVSDAIRSAIGVSITPAPRPYVLDIGAGTGRIGQAFLAAGDAYVGVDLSLGMLREFAAQTAAVGKRFRCLTQADGERLPFRDATFDVVLLFQVLSAVRRWRGLVDEACRVLKSGGNVVVGHVVGPQVGIDAQMKSRLATILSEFGVALQRPRETRDEALTLLQSVTRRAMRVVAASWSANRTPREFIARHRTGARFAALPPGVQELALQSLSAWAEACFGSLDASFPESFNVELHAFECY